ncbi:MULTISPECIES: gamma-glutamylcyclotransferase family protein [Curtobacterium]|uniref:Gamma-glutamylcyclotransferase n=1 Tax=Curtobacterium poinsettiae TaxID=159612 RepID=A0ABT3S5Y8_9MICO|nr:MULTISPECIES: gamma-glutamylcyclotransferase family protein [Curtobacterium]MCX2850238.1 gamma-glutamylcyclotransferase [Curtobacterium flaccumfaciens pv. poinsettiae]UXN18424.1 gamma-glutamylcyclotransferase [Curtobacterium flaccumfaciens pv. poinsettiae]UXZ57237.1 gamma-glutamylcyclotransferase [Curtobacterium sp. Arg-1]
MKRLSPGQRWVIGLGAFALVCLVVGIIAFAVGFPWGGVVGIIGLLHLGLTGLAGALVWTSTPAIAPRPVKRPTPRPGATHRVFSYGTLQQPLVQESLFGDHVPTTADSLPGWRLDWVTITDPDVIRTSGSDRHPILRRGAAGDVVEGVALTLGYEWQLRAVDDYEVADYQRIQVTLASGWTAWVYVAADEA